MRTFTLTLLLSFLLFGALQAQDQVELTLDNYQIHKEALEKPFHDASADFYFKLKTESTSGDYATKQVMEFDPRRPIGQRWKLLSKNGNRPTADDVKYFDKGFNTTTPNTDAKINTDTWSVIEDTKDHVKIKFNYDRRSVPKKFSYIAEMDGIATINKSTGLLEQIEFQSDEKIRKGILKILEMDLVIYMKKVDGSDTYVIDKEISNMKVKMLGQVLNATEDQYYMDYRKI